MTRKHTTIVLIAILAMMSGCAKQGRGVMIEKYRAIVIDATVLFDFDSSELREDAKPILNEVAEKIKDNPDVFIVLEGHTDAIGSAEYNEVLAEKRARAAGAYLSQMGIKYNKLTFISMGEKYPKDKGKTRKAHSVNRRVEIYNN